MFVKHAKHYYYFWLRSSFILSGISRGTTYLTTISSEVSPAKIIYRSFCSKLMVSPWNATLFSNFFAFKLIIVYSDKVAIVLDPPFGGFVSLIVKSLKKIVTLWREVNSRGIRCTAIQLQWRVLQHFVYSFGMQRSNRFPTNFLDLPLLPRIEDRWRTPDFRYARLPGTDSHHPVDRFTINVFSFVKTIKIRILFLQVEYDNHKKFKKGKTETSKGSPVRIFTNVAPYQVRLPEQDGYR